MKKYRKQITVICKKCGRVPENEVESLDIEEDFQGRDILTFKCTCGETNKSLRFG